MAAKWCAGGVVYPSLNVENDVLKALDEYKSIEI